MTGPVGAREPDRRRVLGWLTASAAASLLSTLPGDAGEVAAPAVPTGRDPLAGRFGGPFLLTSHDGRRVSDTDFRGQFMLVYFGYTRCDDLCPVDLAVIARAIELVGRPAERLQPLFVTVDPARDTEAALAAYVTAFTPRLIGLTGTEAEIAAVARAYKVRRQKVKSDLSDETAFIIDHGSLAYLMGPDGGFLTLLPHTTTPEAMAKVLTKYLVQG